MVMNLPCFGGNGGKGGSVILECSHAIWDFSNLQHHLNGNRGGHGYSKRRVGSRGSDKIVQVPIGSVIHLASGCLPSVKDSAILPDAEAWQHEETQLEDTRKLTATWSEQLQEDLSSFDSFSSSTDSVLSSIDSLGTEDTEGSTIHDSDRDTLTDDECENSDVPSGENNCDTSTEDEYENSDVFSGERNSRGTLPSLVESNVAELVSSGECLIVAVGGQGGRGNAAMARGAGKKKGLPSREHEPGLPGSEAVMILELKTIADVGLVGLPNAGKSTLLGAISRAKPMVGHYAFTTLRPNIGKVIFEDHFALTVADIPGLIQGAHEDKGLGFAFLRHIERTKALAYVLDLASALGDNKGIPPWDQFDQLKNELEKYQSGLSNRPSLVVANKIDEDGAEEVLNELIKRLPSLQVYPVCAVLEEGTSNLKQGLRALLYDAALHTPSLSQLRI